MRKLSLLIFVVLVFAFSIQAQTSTNNSASSSSTTETKEKKKVFRATKDQITQAQKMLKEKGKYAGAEDGKYNNDFRASVKGFQGENGLRKSGSLNRATLEKMGIALTDAQTEIPVNPNDLASADDANKTTPKRGPVFRASKEQITEVQTKLKTGGMYSGEATGKLDDPTREAIKKWQTANGVKVTGTLNKETLEKMGIELTEKQKAM
jgi:peptidoglycan hydrolase-like protein with peptidoglycan-binding domain